MPVEQSARDRTNHNEDEARNHPDPQSYSWKKQIRKLVEEEHDGEIVIVGVGHPFKSDDSVGSLIARDLARKDFDRGRVMVVDAESSPENVLPRILNEKARLLILIDSLDAGLPSGSVKLVDANELSDRFFTSHNIPLGLMLQTCPRTHRAVLLGVQPGNLDVGEILSQEVQDARSMIVGELSGILESLEDEPIGD